MEKTKNSNRVSGFLNCPGCGVFLPLDEFAAALLYHPIYISGAHVLIFCPRTFPNSIKIKISKGSKMAQEVRA